MVRMLCAECSKVLKTGNPWHKNIPRWPGDFNVVCVCRSCYGVNTNTHMVPKDVIVQEGENL